MAFPGSYHFHQNTRSPRHKRKMRGANSITATPRAGVLSPPRKLLVSQQAVTERCLITLPVPPRMTFVSHPWNLGGLALPKRLWQKRCCVTSEFRATRGLAASAATPWTVPWTAQTGKTRDQQQGTLSCWAALVCCHMWTGTISDPKPAIPQRS